jgi:hypothetical protein
MPLGQVAKKFFSETTLLANVIYQFMVCNRRFVLGMRNETTRIMRDHYYFHSPIIGNDLFFHNVTECNGANTSNMIDYVS